MIVIKHTLFIIGNGFDLFHGLHTSPNDFEALLDKEPAYECGCSSAKDAFECCNVYNWNEWEDSLSGFDATVLEDKIEGPDYLSDHESDRDGPILEMEQRCNELSSAIGEALSKMVEQANEDLLDKDDEKPFASSGDSILTFNYTSTIECLYTQHQNTNLFHLHGCREDNEELIFGYPEKSVEEEKWEKGISDSSKSAAEMGTPGDGPYDDYYIHEQIIRITQFYNGMQKKYQMDKLRDFLGKCGSVSDVTVLGHSMGNVDSKYMELIDKIILPKRWHISSHNGSPSQSELSSYSFNKKIDRFRMDARPWPGEHCSPFQKGKDDFKPCNRTNN